MRIDVATGALSTIEGVIVPRVGREEFLNTPVGLRSHEIIRNEGKITYKVLLNEESLQWAMHLLFESESLSVVSFALVCEGDNWSNWSEEKEMEKEKALKKILQISLGEPPYIFSWEKQVLELTSGQVLLTRF